MSADSAYQGRHFLFLLRSTQLHHPRSSVTHMQISADAAGVNHKTLGAQTPGVPQSTPIIGVPEFSHAVVVFILLHSSETHTFWHGSGSRFRLPVFIELQC